MRSPLCRTRRTPTAPGATHPTALDPTAPRATDRTAPRAAPAADHRAPRPTAPRATPRAAVARSALAALAASLLLAGCSSVWEGSRGGAQPAAAGSTQDVLLQPLAAQGPDPFTESSARATARGSSPARGPDSGGPQVREVTGSTPGLYGGTRAEGSCDVERQVASLSADQDRTRAFAEAAGIPDANLPDWLRGLTPVVLRSDTRVTNHGYREGKAKAFQSVLQTGTAVLVDQYGSPRVRCACGNPLRTPAAVRDGIHQGEPWDGFDPDRVIVVRPTTTVVTSLVIVNNADRSWIERATGSDGAEDRKPAVEPDCDPDACALADATPDGATPDRRTSPGPATPDDPSRPVPPAPVPPAPENPLPDASGTGGTDPGPVDPDPYPVPDADPYQDPNTDPRVQPDPADPYAEPPGEQTVPDGELPPEELFPARPVPDQPETFEG
ncbi:MULTISPECIES: DUF6777 domain-containing protein [unclassified Streptomyces]|uniref:DUF6777 domain-containing protein n=1 Tax=unclassified Streptomyces TaxID=2593676 RepID=UPI001E3D9669|nr:DUF6777 domain-containing protein [Streptomyces sp. CB02980]MCB8901808.1 hypothetical protein [Streptomyces sp. CB02980]